MVVGFDHTPDNMAYLEFDQMAGLLDQAPFTQAFDGTVTSNNYLVSGEAPAESVHPVEGNLMKYPNGSGRPGARSNLCAHSVPYDPSSLASWHNQIVRPREGADHIDLSIQPGQVIGLVGENVPDKSTLVNTVADIRFSHQKLSLAPSISVFENLFLGTYMARRSAFIDPRALRLEARELLAAVGLDDVEPDSSLSRDRLIRYMAWLSVECLSSWPHWSCLRSWPLPTDVQSYRQAG